MRQKAILENLNKLTPHSLFKLDQRPVLSLIQPIAERFAKNEQQLAGSSVEKFLRPAIEQLPTALGILALALLSPLLAKAIAYYLIAPAEAIPVPDHSVDTVVSTLVLCTVDDPAAAMAEIRRVLRPGGRLLFLEHVRSADPALARSQDRWDPVWKRIGHGCRCNRATLATVEASGLRVESVEDTRIPKATSIVRPAVMGVAVLP